MQLLFSCQVTTKAWAWYCSVRIGVVGGCRHGPAQGCWKKRGLEQRHVSLGHVTVWSDGIIHTTVVQGCCEFEHSYKYGELKPYWMLHFIFFVQILLSLSGPKLLLIHCGKRLKCNNVDDLTLLSRFLLLKYPSFSGKLWSHLIKWNISNYAFFCRFRILFSC